jgi:hypothetical protein
LTASSTRHRKLLDPLFAQHVARPNRSSATWRPIDAFADGEVDFEAFCEPLPTQIFSSPACC